MFEDMVHTRLWLRSRQRVNLYWWGDDPKMPEYIEMDEDFDRFWNEVVPNKMGFIELGSVCNVC